LMWTTPHAPGATKYLLNWPSTDVNITMLSCGSSILAMVRVRSTIITAYSDEIALPDNSDRIQHQFVLQQGRESEEMLVEREAAVDAGTSIATLYSGGLLRLRIGRCTIIHFFVTIASLFLACLLG
jgi:hypothetical protein